MTYITPAIESYATEHSAAEPELLRELAAATRELSDSHGMMVGRLEGRFLKMLVWATGARRVLEVGTFTGYSALSMAEALPPDGRLITCELDERHAEVARRFIERSAYAEVIELRLGPAIETLAELEGPFELIFIDADKAGYRDYYEAALPLLSAELAAASDERARREELGDLLLVVANLARRLGVDAEAALRSASAKFAARFAAVERLAAERGVELRAMTLEELDEMWETAKSAISASAEAAIAGQSAGTEAVTR